VLDKHLETLKAKGCRRLIMDLSSVTLICSTGIATLLQNLKRFQEDGCEGLMLVCTDKAMREILATFGCRFFEGESFFTDWPSLAARVRAFRGGGDAIETESWRPAKGKEPVN
jgi:anti-anti-sigma regulatory factor